jgi:hypothetical protein
MWSSLIKSSFMLHSSFALSFVSFFINHQRPAVTVVFWIRFYLIARPYGHNWGCVEVYLLSYVAWRQNLENEMVAVLSPLDCMCGTAHNTTGMLALVRSEKGRKTSDRWYP